MREVQSDAQLRLVGCAAQHRGDRAEQQDRVAVLASARAPRCALGVRVAGATAGMNPHSTFAAILVQPDRVDWCHVGDSRVYHVRDGRLLHRTIDHSVAETIGKTLNDSGTLQPPGVAPNALTDALGTLRTPRPTLAGMREPRAGDTFLLCSDGLWNQVGADEITRDIVDGPPRAAAERLVAKARARAGGRGDNCSLVLLSVTSAPATGAALPGAAAPPPRPFPSDDGSGRARAPRAA